MNGPIRKLAVLCALLVGALLVNMSVAFVVSYPALGESQQNRRVLDARFAQRRGPIMVGTTAVATSKKVKDRFKYQREYVDGPLYAPITGYYTYYYGATALEASESGWLSGQQDELMLDQLINNLAGSEPAGATVETTISAAAQEAAWDALDGRKGAVVALSTDTGAIRALVTSPSYDPNLLATHDLDASKEAWDKLTKAKDKPMRDRATDEIYPTGSAFKLITAAAALEEGLVADAETPIDATTFTTKQTSHTIAQRCGGDTITIARAMVVSCNPAFARLGAELGITRLQEQAAKFGFGTKPLTEVSSTASRLYNETAHEGGLDDMQVAMTAIGEFEVGATPLQMAMVAAAIQNGGVVMKPYLVQRVLTDDLKTAYQATPEVFGEAISTETAAALRAMMVDVVTTGTGSRAAVPGIEVGGKTGTFAPEGSERRYAWFVAFAAELDIAVCAFVEGDDIENTDIGGARAAAPIAKAVIEALR
ncbi:MAG: penicillin-binding protein 2 [Propionibacteriaceae bacterium]|jgi:peptidoglycan glycosyltransferase|nr:penicillin-binding protein 2 [Propionibacteriaceae bacterium]